MTIASKSHRLLEMLKELRAHALWDGLKELFRWETLTGTPKYLGMVGGTLLAGIQWMEHHHGFLFVLGVCIGSVSLVVIGVMVGRGQRSSQSAVQQPMLQNVPQPTTPEPATNDKNEPKSVRLIREESKTVTRGNQTFTTTVRQVIEISFAIIICVGGVWLFRSEPALVAREASMAQLTSAEPRIVYEPEAEEGRTLSLDRDRFSPPRRMLRKKGSEDSLSESSKFPRRLGDPDSPVWVTKNSEVYFCYGPEWSILARNTDGNWMKQSEARSKGKRPFRDPC